MHRRYLRWSVALTAVGLVVACSRDDAAAGAARAASGGDPATLVGRAACARCHAEEILRWTGSHHDLAMQEVGEATVLGDFDDATFTHHGVTSRFFRDGDRFMVRTDGPDGVLTDYEVAYVFGVEPLQQYLIRFPGGRLQTLSLCWDARSADQGGQRWFHLYGDERIAHDDELHWTGSAQNWNHMCADCHSTALDRGYDLATDSYDTTWAELDVSCEACHGPGSRHVAWADAAVAADGEAAGEGMSEAAMGLVVSLRNQATWVFDDGAVTARREPAPAPHPQAEACAPCHSRRGVIADGWQPGAPLLDTHDLSLLEERLYHPDGQILDEVYVYGSFVQSRMYHAGVTCTDCHEPHTLQLLSPGNALCTRCHQAGEFDTTAHHLHEPDSAGAACTACHMPERAYMQVDLRADHSLRVPRPDLTRRIGVPNACNGCHDDRSAQWADEALRQHYGADYRPGPHYGTALQRGRTGAPGAREALLRLVADAEQPAIARATAVELLSRYPNGAALEAVAAAAGDDAALVRAAAVQALDAFPHELAADVAAARLEDPVRLVRAQAARVLAAAPPGSVSPERLPALEAALDDYLASQRANADRSWSHVNLALVWSALGRAADAEAALRTALRIDPRDTRAYVNLADLYRAQGRDDLAEPLLREGLDRALQPAPLRHALGLLLARTGRLPEALVQLGQAAAASPEDPGLAYAHAVALHSSGEVDRALEVLEGARRRHPHDREILFALVAFHRDRGATDQALRWATELVALDPDDQGAQQLLESLRR